MSLAQRCCKLCGGTFETERKRGGQRSYCFTCSPSGWQVVKVRGRYKLRRRPSLFAVMRVQSDFDFSDSVALNMLLEQSEADDVALSKLLEQNDDAALRLLLEQNEADWSAWQATPL